MFGNNYGMDAKTNTPANIFPISSLPWATFTGFNLSIFIDGSYLLPIFTYGKYFQQDGKYLIPLSIQVQHAVCDGFHVSELISEIQQICNDIK
jgi:chloramphenicol O-acetyltransferase type A